MVSTKYIYIMREILFQSMVPLFSIAGIHSTLAISWYAQEHGLGLSEHISVGYSQVWK
jgi:hypothetical protein